jgi:hypothetical protein
MDKFTDSVNSILNSITESQHGGHYDFERDVEINGKVYTVKAAFNWENKPTGHQASIGHEGVTHKDRFQNMPSDIKWIEVVDDAGPVNDPVVIQNATDIALEQGSEDARSDSPSSSSFYDPAEDAETPISTKEINALAIASNLPPDPNDPNSKRAAIAAKRARALAVQALTKSNQNAQQAVKNV